VFESGPAGPPQFADVRAGAPFDSAYFIRDRPPVAAGVAVTVVFDARNRALHDAQDQFPIGTAVTFQRRVDEVILAGLDWAARTSAMGLADLDAAMAQLPRPRAGTKQKRRCQGGG